MVTLRTIVFTWLRSFIDNTATYVIWTFSGRNIKQDLMTDFLTGVLNRRGMDNECHKLDRRRKKHGERVLLMFIDFDDFKLVNTQIGYSRADKLLTWVFQELRKMFREEDIVTRYGGDELVIMSTAIPQEQVQALVNRIHNLPVSCGFWWLEPGDDLYSALERASEEMKSNKARRKAS